MDNEVFAKYKCEGFVKTVSFPESDNSYVDMEMTLLYAIKNKRNESNI